MKVSANFDLREYIHTDIYTKIGDRSADFLHPRLIYTVQALRERFGAIRINDWHTGGRFESSGLRLPHGGVGAMLSSHKFGTAADLKFASITPEEVQNAINSHQDQYPFISRMENAIITKTWLHIECGSRRVGSIIVFNH